MAAGDTSKNANATNWALGQGGSTATQATILGGGAALVGKLVSHGNVEVHGHFQGDIETPATIIIGESGSVEGGLKAGSVVVRGSLIGTIQAKDVVRLAKTARVRADVAAGQLEMEAGAELVGACSVTGGQPANMDVPKGSVLKG